ncbi:putative transcriptional regulator [Nocardiopsis mwathae]|uniref:Putative transcriptional regulator n=1 Tax=Nocardiopsis mwathae TaxID=1472723 RepID=A0A7W9YJJ4_9ACTN|nr:BlaI/MecI/CopY family transcriptional regulator [Nocardiopsis mwathae]MBB6173334.1 putative transcriptional regulator [Nocardiopsis mwathae]
MGGFGPLERVVMDIVWDAAEPVTVRAVTEALDDRDLAYTTISTVLQKLFDKGWLERERIGRVWFYRAAVGRSDYAARVMHEALHESGGTRSTLLRFVDAMSDEEARMLRDLLSDGGGREDRGDSGDGGYSGGGRP